MQTNVIDSPLKTNRKAYFHRQSLVQIIRPMTLTGTITPILVGTGFAAKTGDINFGLFFALLLSALLIQGATNILNDYYDFKYGQDKEKWVASEDHPLKHGPAHSTLPYIAAGMFAIAVVVGTWLAISSTLWIIVAGIAGIAAGYKYSAGSRSFSSIGMGELVAFLFLGPVVTALAYVVQRNPIHFQIIGVALPFALLIASMILTNNIRDLQKDIGFRQTLANRLGRRNAIYLLVLLLVAPYITIGLLIIYEVLSLPALLVVLAFPLAIRLFRAFRKNAAREEEIDGMKWAAIHHWAFGLFYAVAIMFMG